LELYFATLNRNKFKELSYFLEKELISAQLDLCELQTDDLEKIIVHKLKQAYQKLKAPVIVEDTSLYFEAWKELPGPLIKWFLKNFGLKGMVQALSPFKNKYATAVSCLGFTTDGQKIHYFRENVKGTIVNPRGSESFGWDAIFKPIGQQLTFGEMSNDEKLYFSPRGKVTKKFKEFLKPQVKQK